MNDSDTEYIVEEEIQPEKYTQDTSIITPEANTCVYFCFEFLYLRILMFQQTHQTSNQKRMIRSKRSKSGNGIKTQVQRVEKSMSLYQEQGPDLPRVGHQWKSLKKLLVLTNSSK